MEITAISSVSMMGGGPPAAREDDDEDYASWTPQQKMEDVLACDPPRNIWPRHPDTAASIRKDMREMYEQFSCVVSPMLFSAFSKDSVRMVEHVCVQWGRFTGIRGILYPDILTNMASDNALRCAAAALQGTPLFRRRRADPNARNIYGFAPLHMAAELFSVDMVRLLLRHGASASVRTKGDRVIQGLLPLHVAVENAAMHKYLEDHWADGDPIDHLIFLLCLPEMKMFLDTTRLIAKHTGNIVDEVWNYVDNQKIAQAAILLLAAQKQLRLHDKKSSTTIGHNNKVKVSLNAHFDIANSHIADDLDTLHREGLAMVKQGRNGMALKKLKERKEALLTMRVTAAAALGKDATREVLLDGFDIIKSRIDKALDANHSEGLAMVQQGKNGKALKKLNDRKEAFLTAHALVGIVHKAGQALEGYIQTHSQAPYDDILERVSSILISNGITPVGKGIDTTNLECYPHYGRISVGNSISRRVHCGETNEADMSPSMKGEVSKRILGKRPPKGVALKVARNLFFPYWKSVLSRGLLVKIVPSCELTKDLQSAEASRKGTKSSPNKSMGNLGSIGFPLFASNYECRRMICAVASMSQKVLKHA